jgi:hypothetical protein
MKNKIQALHDGILSSIENIGCVLITKSEHAALVAVAEAADLVGKANMRLLEAQRDGDKTAIGNATADLWCELDRLEAVRAGSEVAK